MRNAMIAMALCLVVAGCACDKVRLYQSLTVTEKPPSYDEPECQMTFTAEQTW